MALSARRRTAIKKGAFAVAIAIVFVALILAPQLFHTSTRPGAPGAPVATIADVTETSPPASADVAKTRPRPSSLSTAIIARGEHSLDELATVRGSDVDLSETSDLDSWLVQIPGTSVPDLFSGADDLVAGDQPLDVPETQLAGYYPRGPWAGGFGVGPRGDSAASGNAAGGNGGAPGLNTQANSSQFNPSSPGGNNGDRGTGNNNGGNGNSNGGNGNNNTGQPNDTNPHGNEHSHGESHSSSGNNPSDGSGPGPATLFSNGSSETPVSVPEPSTLLLAGFGLSGLMARRLTQKAR